MVTAADPGLRASHVALADGSGSRSGSVVGQSALSPSFLFGLSNPAGAARGTATASLDIWLTFSAQPIFDLPRPDNDLPEPATPVLVLLGGLLAAAWRRARPGRTGGLGLGPAVSDRVAPGPASRVV